MKKLTYFLLVMLIAASCSKQSKVAMIVSADSLATNVGEVVCAEGTVVNICPCGGQKLKLQLADGSTLKVVPNANAGAFTNDLNEKKVKVSGELSEERLSKKYLDSLYLAQVIISEVDYTPCTDTAWINYQWREGSAEKMLASVSINLNRQMEKTGKDYISVFCIKANSIELIEEK